MFCEDPGIIVHIIKRFSAYLFKLITVEHLQFRLEKEWIHRLSLQTCNMMLLGRNKSIYLFQDVHQMMMFFFFFPSTYSSLS